MRVQLNRQTAIDYQIQRSNEAWADHRARTQVTGALIAWLRPMTVMDPACGDGSIVAAADRAWSIAKGYLGDISAPNIASLTMHFPVQTAVCDITEALDVFPDVDVIVLTEVLEHLPDPDLVLALARRKGAFLVASSPEMRAGQLDINPEHLWQFDREGYREMLVATGWTPMQYTFLHFESEYDFGIWVCR